MSKIEQLKDTIKMSPHSAEIVEEQLLLVDDMVGRCDFLDFIYAEMSEKEFKKLSEKYEEMILTEQQKIKEMSESESVINDEPITEQFDTRANNIIIDDISNGIDGTTVDVIEEVSDKGILVTRSDYNVEVKDDVWRQTEKPKRGRKKKSEIKESE